MLSGSARQARGVRVLALALLLPAGGARAGDERVLVETQDLDLAPAGAVRASLGAAYLSGYFQPPSGLSGNLTRLGTFGTDIGVASNVQLRVRGVFYESLAVDSRLGGGTPHDIGDVETSLLVRILGPTSKRPALGLKVGGKIPTSDDRKGIETNTLDFFVTGAAEHAFGAVTVSAEAGITFLTDSRLATSQNDVFIYGLSASWPATNRLTILFDWHGRAGSTTKGKGAEDKERIRAGLAADLKLFTLSAMTGPGLARTSENWSVSVALARTIPVF